MNDHNLDDLIIGEPRSGGRRAKNILAVAALLIVVLVAGITLAKLFFAKPAENMEIAQAEVEELVAPEPETAKANPKEKKETIPKRDIPDELKPLKEEKLPETPLKSSSSDSRKSAEKKKSSARESISEKAKKPVTKKENISAVKKAEKSAKKQSPEKPKAKSAQTETKSPAAKKTQAKKAAVEKISAKKAKAAASKKSTRPSQLFKQAAAAKGGKYYIQIGSFGKIPDDSYLKGIKAKGYQYTIVEKEGRYKIWVGPYDSYEASKAKLPEVKEKLNPSAFTVRKQ